ncbi:MAG: type II toxin-antitoxin system VapC family toxin [Actinomycetes bacterium]
MIVLDASAAVEMVLGTPSGAAVTQEVRSQRLNAPHLLAVEVTQALRGMVMRGTIAEQEAVASLADLRSLLIRRWRHEPLLERAWELRANLTAYDAVYVALAEALEAVLVTTDARLARAGGHDATVEVVTT